MNYDLEVSDEMHTLLFKSLVVIVFITTRERSKLRPIGRSHHLAHFREVTEDVRVMLVTPRSKDAKNVSQGKLQTKA